MADTVRVKVGVIVYKATFNNISVISCRSVLLVEEIGVPNGRTNKRWNIIYI